MITTKLTIENYIEMKNKLKFLEFNWQEYKKINPDFEEYQYTPEIQAFVENELYEQVTTQKVHKLTKKVTISTDTLELLKTYAHISDNLKEEMQSF